MPNSLRLHIPAVADGIAAEVDTELRPACESNQVDTLRGKKLRWWTSDSGEGRPMVVGLVLVSAITYDIAAEVDTALGPACETNQVDTLRGKKLR